MKTLQETINDLSKYSVIVNSIIIEDFLNDLLITSQEEKLVVYKRFTHRKLTKRKLTEMLAENFQNKIYLAESEEEYVFFKLNVEKYFEKN